jgi:hypothetical protein
MDGKAFIMKPHGPFELMEDRQHTPSHDDLPPAARAALFREGHSSK